MWRGQCAPIPRKFVAGCGRMPRESGHRALGAAGCGRPASMKKKSAKVGWYKLTPVCHDWSMYCAPLVPRTGP